MGPRKNESRTLLERVLALLEERFPWLGSARDEPIGGSGDSIDMRPEPDQPAVQKPDEERPGDSDPES